MKFTLPIVSSTSSHASHASHETHETHAADEATASPTAFDRRTFIEYMSAALAAAGMSTCRGAAEGNWEDREKIVPFSRPPPDMVPGRPLHYATAMELDGYATGLLVESREGRPIKIEGNPEHPISLGSSGSYEQASILQLYDSDRARGILEGGQPSTWQNLRAALLGELGEVDQGGDGLHLLLAPTSSPIVRDLLAEIRRRYPRASIHFYSPTAPVGRWQATQSLYGRAMIPHHRFEDAAVVFSLDDDFLTCGPTWLRDARGYAAARIPKAPASEIVRLYMAECGFSSTGAKADHRLALTSQDVLRLAGVVGRGLLFRPSSPLVELQRALRPVLERFEVDETHRVFADAVVGDLLAARGRSVVLAGLRQPKEVHALAMLMNHALGNVGRTVLYTEDPVLGLEAGDLGAIGEVSYDLSRLASALKEGRVSRLVIAGGNPVYTAPADLNFGVLLQRAKLSAYLGPYDNETALACRWRIAEVHYLESWADTRSADGSVSIIQPLIRPLFGGRTVSQLLGLFAGLPDANAREMVRQKYARSNLDGNFPENVERPPEWRSGFERMLALGVVPNTQAPMLNPSPNVGELGSWLRRVRLDEPGIELVLMPDRQVFDGRFSNNPWLLELPDPITRLCWGNAALIAPTTATRLGLKTGNLIRIAVDGQHTMAPVCTFLGLPENTVTLSLGFGRRGLEHNAAGLGVNAFSVRITRSPWFMQGAEIDRLDESAEELGLMPVSVQPHQEMHGRPIILSKTIAAYRKDPQFADRHDEPPPSIHPPWPAPGHQWGMAIDLNACVGCNACVVACQAENNVPVVGKTQVELRREMHWLRLDLYHVGESGSVDVAHQPMLCQHCEKAPCEYVCPTYATSHSPDGLNEMTYNRCIGTRFCSNNCPYKVRRFNWFDWNREISDVSKLQFNPEVTVRERGVMEKCTYCVQRIRRTEIEAKNVGRDILPDEIVTACAQACPSRAIVFGDISDPRWTVVALHQDLRAYAVLHDTGTRPRTRYLARITNPHPSLERPEEQHDEETGNPS